MYWQHLVAIETDQAFETGLNLSQGDFLFECSVVSKQLFHCFGKISQTRCILVCYM